MSGPSEALTLRAPSSGPTSAEAHLRQENDCRFAPVAFSASKFPRFLTF
jgi:hypothetical protein